MRKMYKTVILLIIITILISPVVATDNSYINKSITYRILIDQTYGFFRTYEMYDKLLGNKIIQENNTLNISKGDTVIFVSGDVTDRIVTVVSKEKLWTDINGTLKYGGKEFSYTFNKHGVYNIYIGERPLTKQKIIVGQIDISETNKTETNINKQNLANDSKPNQINESNRSSSTNTTRPNLTVESSRNKYTIKQNLTTNKSTSTPIISVSLADGLFDKIKSRSDVSILTIVLIGIYILSGRIKDD